MENRFKYRYTRIPVYRYTGIPVYRYTALILTQMLLLQDETEADQKSLIYPEKIIVNCEKLSPPSRQGETEAPRRRSSSGTTWRSPVEPQLASPAAAEPGGGRRPPATPEAVTGWRHMPAHESMIARELREQSEREAELRAHWQSMGLETAQPCSADTPFDPHQLQMRAHPRGGGRDAGACVRYGGAAAVNGGASPVQNGGDVSAASPRAAVASPRPVLYAPDDVDGGAPYTPQAETAVEKEVRLAEDRERELRSARGLPPPEPQPVDVVLPDPADEPPFAVVRRSPSNVGETMQRLASGRLQAEMRRDQQKELALRSEGKIRTTSDELTGLPPPHPATTPSPPTTASRSPDGRKPKPTKCRTETKIEEELREMQEREDELR